MKKKSLAAGLIALVASLAGRAETPPSFRDVSPPDGYYGSRVQHLAVHPLDGRLIAAGEGRVHVSTDGGASWRETASFSGSVHEIFAHNGRPGLVFLRGAGLEVVGFSATRSPGFTWVSNDFGETWSTLANEDIREGELVMSPFASDPRQPGHLLATNVVHGFGHYLSNTPPAEVGLVESGDGGATWSQPLTSVPFMGRELLTQTSIVYIGRRGIRSKQGPTPATPERIFLTTHDGHSYVSATFGRSWAAFPDRPMGRFFWVRQDPTRAEVIYASAALEEGAGRGVLRSTDSGSSWELIYRLEADAADAADLAIDPVRASRLWLTASTTKVLYSEDRGATWQAVQLPESCDPRCTYFNEQALMPRIIPSAADSRVYLLWNGRVYRGGLPSRGRVAVEYRYGNRFWIADDAAEAISQDYRANEAVRTGQRFGLWGGNDSPAGAAGFCRFQGNPSQGQSSRFLTLKGAECGALRADPGWVLEGEDESFAVPAGPGGQCAAGSVAVTRFVNGLRNANHRYVVDSAVAHTMRASGWIEEGVAFCARPLESNE